MRILPEDGISRQNGITMFFSILLASTLWFLVIINQKNHKSSFTLPIFIHNLPQNVDFLKPVPDEIEVAVEGLGVDLLIQHFRYEPDTIQLYYTEGTGHLLPRDYFSQIVQKAPKSTYIKVLYVSPDTLPIQFEHRTQKRVKLYSKAILQLAPSFQLEEARIIRPDSVNISGPQSMLDSINAWYTIPKEVFIEKEKERVVLPIDTLKGIRVAQKSAILEVVARPYTQKQVIVNLVIEDLPDGFQVNLSQDKVKLSCLVPMKFYTQLKQTYQLTIPFSKLDDAIPYFIPNLEGVLPPFAKVVTRNPLQVDFVIVEELNVR